jgi:hypothetical protein
MYLATEIEFDLSLKSWCHDLAVEGCGVSGPDVALHSVTHIVCGEISDSMISYILLVSRQGKSCNVLT